jgi:APA family basic amino acid/polyamine antiporter
VNHEPKRNLVRAIGRWSLAALMVNTMIGASIFGLPSLIAARLGRLSPAAYLVAGAGVAFIAACLAEVASQFREAGGPYLYARAAFGQFVAIQVGWLTWLTRIAASSAVANLFVSYLSEFFPAVNNIVTRAAVLTVLIAFLAAVNYRGVSSGNRLSNFFTITKLFLLLLFIGGGITALLLHPAIRVTPARVAATASDWFEAVILMVYAFGGFEAALIVTGEARNPRKDAPVALLAALVTTTLLYISVQYVVIHTLPSAGSSIKPAVDSARYFLGPAGATLVAAGTLVAVYGYLSANMLHTPRLTYAMGESGDFPKFFAAIHPRFHTPHISIVIFAVIILLFSIGGNFEWNATLSAVSRLFIYGSVAAALPALRKKRPHADAFRLPAGMLFAGVALLFTGVLVTRMHRRELVVMAITSALALVNWLWARRRPQQLAG